MGKCILAGHPPVGGQVGYGTYTGTANSGSTLAERTQEINLGVMSKWVLVAAQGAIAYGSQDTGNYSVYGGLAVGGSSAKIAPDTNTVSVEITTNGFKVFYGIGSSSPRTNQAGITYHYIYGT